MEIYGLIRLICSVSLLELKRTTCENGSGSNDADNSASGITPLFNPASPTYVKHFISQFSRVAQNDYNGNNFSAGYFNTTSAINAIDFKMSSGNFDGTILMYGIK